MAQPIILLASTSLLKKGAVISYFMKHYPTIKPIIECLNCDSCGLPPQPIACGLECAAQRMAFAIASYGKPYDMVISIESDLKKSQDKYYDQAHIRIMANGIVGIGVSDSIWCPVELSELETQKEIIYTDKIHGYAISGGEILAKRLGYDPKNWMLQAVNRDRVDQICVGIEEAMNDLLRNITNCYKISTDYKLYDDFPKTGVKFKYFYSIFVKPRNMSFLADIITSKYAGCEVDAVIPLESRGLVLGAIAADRLKASMIPMQKPGKIPGEKVTIQYGKEYGTDEIQFSIELLEEFIQNKKACYHFLVIDDLVATGGSISASLAILDKLAQKYGFRYKTTVFALEDVAPLREDAKKVIKCQYDILFRDIKETYEGLQYTLINVEQKN